MAVSPHTQGFIEFLACRRGLITEFKSPDSVADKSFSILKNPAVLSQQVL
jgi:hypothetical protein